ncbi:hypothetical protein BBJ41_27710 [Burkholderia stabilis]|nr:hypothetical protein BBJ41_27710 [Burkholderia stabilis]
MRVHLSTRIANTRRFTTTTHTLHVVLILRAGVALSMQAARVIQARASQARDAAARRRARLTSSSPFVPMRRT